MQKIVVDAPDKLENGETFGPGGVRVNGKMKVQYKNPEKLEDYMKRANEAKYGKGGNLVYVNEEIDNRARIVVEEFVWKVISEGWERHGDKVVALFWDALDNFVEINGNKKVIKALQIIKRTTVKTAHADKAIFFQQKQQGVSAKNKGVC